MIRTIRLECTGRKTHSRKTLTRMVWVTVDDPYGSWVGDVQSERQMIDMATGKPFDDLTSWNHKMNMRPRLRVQCPTCRRTFTIRDDHDLGPVLSAARAAGVSHVDLSLLIE